MSNYQAPGLLLLLHFAPAVTLHAKVFISARKSATAVCCLLAVIQCSFLQEQQTLTGSLLPPDSMHSCFDVQKPLEH